MGFHDRTLTRGRGCWNCRSFESGALAKQKLDATMEAANARLEILRGDYGDQGLVGRDKVTGKLVPLTRLGELENDVKPTHNARFEFAKHAVNMGAMGLCMLGKAKTDFVLAAFLCDGWNGRTGSSMATSGYALDKLPEEIKEASEEAVKPSWWNKIIKKNKDNR